jgi:hypothetical protein
MKLHNRTLRTVARRPWQRRHTRPYRREVVTMDQAPLAQICIYPDCVILTRREPSGAWRSYPVSPEALIQTLGKLPVTAGILPEGTIGAGLREGDPFYVQHIRPRSWRLHVDEGGQARAYPIELPGLIWAGWRAEYRIYALGAGAICWGSARPPRASAATMGQALRLLLEDSLFNTHLDSGKSRSAPGSVLTLWRRLAKQTPAPTWPLSDLVATGQRLAAVLDGSIWRGR